MVQLRLSPGEGNETFLDASEITSYPQLAPSHFVLDI